MIEISQIKIGVLLILSFNSIATGFISLQWKQGIYRGNTVFRDVFLTKTSQSFFDVTPVVSLCSTKMAKGVNEGHKNDTKKKIIGDIKPEVENRKIIEENHLDVPPSNIVAMSDSNLKSNQVKSKIKTEWTVYVCQSKQCLDRGAGATLGAFVGLAPPTSVTVYPAILLKPKGKGPTIRCIRNNHKNSSAMNNPMDSFEINNVDSVEKVYRILTKTMNVRDINPAACNCLKWNYRGNEYLDKGEISLAIDAYNRAIASNYKEQEGVLLVMRATAYLQRAFNHRLTLKEKIDQLIATTPETDKLKQLNLLLLENPVMAKSILSQRILNDSKRQVIQFQQTKYYHGLYEYALLHATQDSLRATQLLPNYAKTWLRAGDSLAELRKLKESAQYYEKALELDSSLEQTLLPIIERLKTSQEFLDKARANGWTEDTLRVALAVAD